MPYKYLLIFAIVFIPLSCSKEPARGAEKPLVAVSIPPQKYFVNKIAGGLFDVLVMVPPGASPHSYEPRPAQMAGLAQAVCYFAIGTEFENAWLGRLAKARPRLAIVHTDSGIAKIPVGDAPSLTGLPADDRHEGLDPHIWLSPRLVVQQAATITGALCRIDPLHAALFRRNDSLFSLEIAKLQDDIRENLSGRKADEPFMVFHPAWNYFAREFGLREIAIEVEGKEPSPRELGAILDLGRKNGIRTIYVQPQFSRRSAQIIAADIGATVVIADDLTENWEANLRAFAAALERR